MQTFLPFEDYRQSCELLDYQRLGKQRVEGLQLIRLITFRHADSARGLYGWANHPALRLWWNPNACFLPALIEYTQTAIDVWCERGYRNAIDLRLYAPIVEERPGYFSFERPVFSEQLHLSHRCRLTQKFPDYYLPKLGSSIPEHWQSIPYTWEYGRLPSLSKS